MFKMEFGPLIIVKLSTEGKEVVSHELRKRGFKVLSSKEKEHFTYFVTSMSNKLVVKLSLQENLDLKPPREFSSYQALRLANSGVEVVKRAQSTGASAAWVAHSPAVARILMDTRNDEAELNTVCNYYGPHIALSFGFQSLCAYYLKGFALVGMVALIEIVCNPSGTYAAWLPFYCCYITLWSAYHLQRWKQKRTALSFAWRTTGMEETAVDADLVQKSSAADDLQHRQHCLLSALATLGIAFCLLLLARPFAYIDVSLTALLTSGASLPRTQKTKQLVRFVWMVLWALVPYAVGDKVLQPLCEKLTTFEGHANKMHAEHSRVLKQVLLYGAAHYNTLLYRTLCVQDQLVVLQVAMLAHITAHVMWMLYCNDMLLREPRDSAMNSIGDSIEQATTTTTHTTDSATATNTDDTEGNVEATSGPASIFTDVKVTSSADAEPSTSTDIANSGKKAESSVVQVPHNMSSSGDEPVADSAKTAQDTRNADKSDATNITDETTGATSNNNATQHSHPSKATALSPDSASPATATTAAKEGGSGSTSGFGFLPGLIKRTVLDPGLQSARQAVTGDLRGAANTALGAAASATKEGTELVSSTASAMKSAAVQRADAVTSKMSEAASTTVDSAAAAVDTVAASVISGAVQLAVPEPKAEALATPAASSSPTQNVTPIPSSGKAEDIGTVEIKEAIKASSRVRGNSKSSAAVDPYENFLLSEAERPIYNTEKEYLYTTILYGYLVLFSLLCPVAPLLVLLVLWLQRKVMSTRLARCRRPALTKRSSLDHWQFCWEGLSLLALCLNCLSLALAKPFATTSDTSAAGAAGEVRGTLFNAEGLEVVWAYLLPAALAQNRVLCMLVLHQLLLLCRQCISYLIPDMPPFITQEMARKRMQQAHLCTRQRLLQHAQALHATALYRREEHASADAPVPKPEQVGAEQGGEGLYGAIRSTAGSALHMPFQLAGTLRSTVMNATSTAASRNNIAPTAPTIATSASATTSDSPIISPREFHLSRLLQQQIDSPYAFTPSNMTFLTLLPYLLHQLHIGTWIYFPLALLYFSYLQAAKDWEDQKIAMGIVADPNLIKFVLSEMPSWVSDSQFQRVEWLNSALGKLWPTLSTALEPFVCSKLQPLLDDVCHKVLGRIHIARFSLGTVSPKIVGVRLFDTSESSIRLDLELRWAGDPSVVINVGSSQVYTPIEVSNIRLSATLRVELLHLQPSLPCFRAVSLTFMHKPTVEFSLSVARLDLMNIGPSDYNVASMVRKLLHSVLSDAILYPKRVVIPIGGGDGELRQPVGIVSITFVRGMQLKKATMFGSDPYVVACCRTSKQEENKHDSQQQQQQEQEQQDVRTSVKYYSLDPVWQETYDLIVYDKAKQEIQMEVRNANIANRESFLGRCTLPLSSLSSYSKQRRVLSLLSVDTGRLEVECEYIPLVSEKKAGEEEIGQQDRSDHDVLYPEMEEEERMEREKAMVDGEMRNNITSNSSTAMAEEERLREMEERKNEQQQHLQPQLQPQTQTQEVRERGLEDAAGSGSDGNSSDIGDGDSTGSDVYEDEYTDEEYEGEAGGELKDAGDEAGKESEKADKEEGDDADDKWVWSEPSTTSREVAEVAAQLLRTLPDPTSSAASTAFAGAWGSGTADSGDMQHNAGVLSVSGIHVRNLKFKNSSNLNSGGSGGKGGFFSGPTSCYLQCSVGDTQRRTKAVQSNEAPVFSETFHFVSKHPVDAHLRVSMMMEQPQQKELGGVQIHFMEVLQAPGRLLQQEYMLQGDGELQECYVSLNLHWTASSSNNDSSYALSHDH